MVNVWGYSHINFFAPMARFAADGGGPFAAGNEFKQLVKALHAAGIQVILDVVYNHTNEGVTCPAVGAFAPCRCLLNCNFRHRRDWLAERGIVCAHLYVLRLITKYVVSSEERKRSRHLQAVMMTPT